MRNVCNEATTCFLQIFELFRHLVKAVSKLRRFILTLNFDAFGEVPARIALHRMVDFHKRIDHTIGTVIGNDKGG